MCKTTTHIYKHIFISSDAPEIDDSPAYGKAAAEKGSVATLKCKAEGAPEVHFVWYKGSKQLDVSGTKYSKDKTRSALVYYESSLKVHNMTKQDYGQYTCVARNELGQASRIVSLDGTSKYSTVH